jgi:hypothetical protein
MWAFLAVPRLSKGEGGVGLLFPVGEDTFLWGKSSQSGKRAMPLEISLAQRPFGAWKLLVFAQG